MASMKTTNTSAITNKTETFSLGKKRSRNILKAICDLRTLHEAVNSVEETLFNIFGKSVVIHLKTQAKIQNVLTEFMKKKVVE